RNVFSRFINRFTERFIRFQRGCHQLGVADWELIRRKSWAIESFRKFEESCIAALAYVLENGPCPCFNFEIKEAGRRGQLLQPRLKISISIANNSHRAAG